MLLRRSSFRDLDLESSYIFRQRVIKFAIRFFSYVRSICERSLWLAEILSKYFKILERLAVNTKVATVLGSIPASSDILESEGR